MDPENTLASASQRGGNAEFGWFAAGVGSWFGAFGMQMVLFSWLVVGELRASAEWVGVAQTASTVPQLLLLLLGGVTADRLEPRRLLVTLHLAAALPALTLAVAVATGYLTFLSVICYGVALGAMSAFMMPARDALLSRVAGENMIRAVTAMTMVQFASQGVGTLLAGSAEWLGSASVLTVQAAVLASGAAFALKLSREGGPPLVRASESGLRAITGGLREVVGSPLLRATAVLVVSVGLFFIGPFLVIFPLLVRDVYQGGVDELAIVLMLFPAGTILGSLALRARGGLRRKVRATMLALLAGALMLATIGTGPPFLSFIGLTLCWGLAGSVFINASRTVFQEQASASHRGRVLSVYQLALMGGAPVGSLLAGFSSSALGPLHALYGFAGAMFAVVGCVWLGTDAANAG